MMTHHGEKWQQAKAIFVDALDRDPEERDAFVRQACGDDLELTREVVSLLDAHGDAGDLMADPTLAARDVAEQDSRILTESDALLAASEKVAGYRLLERLGEGGFGEVFVAEQAKPVRRKVAVKILKRGMDTRSVVARFEAERQALALMDHPHIAQIFDAGQTEDGRPYFAMELVRGLPLSKYCDVHKLSTRERLELFVRVCDAVQHAHQKGIIHRDLKPTNVLVTEKDALVVPKVIDFGIAKAVTARLTDKTIYTALHQFVGTPDYMSPEQATLGQDDVDTRSDVYALGVMLYELMTGRTPLEASRAMKSTPGDLERLLRESQPLTPSQRLVTLGQDLESIAAARGEMPRNLRKVLRGELDWIIMRALEKDRNRRYDSASALADDVRRYLHDEPVEASPPSTRYRLGKFVRRYRATVTAAAVVVVGLVLGLCGALYGLAEADTQRNRAVSALAQAEAARVEVQVALQRAEQEAENAAARANELATVAYAESLRTAVEIANNGQRESALQLLNGAEIERRGFEWEWVARRVADRGLLLEGHDFEAPIRAADYTPRGDRVLTASTDKSIRVWNPRSRQEVLKIESEQWIFVARFSPDTALIAAAGGTYPASETSFDVQLFDATDGAEAGRLKGHTSWVTGLAWHPHGKFIATCSDDRTVRIWSAETLQQIAVNTDAGSGVFAIGFSPDGETLASLGNDGILRLHDPFSAVVSAAIEVNQKGGDALDFSADGQRILTGDDDGMLTEWSVETGEQLRRIDAHVRSIIAAKYSPDGRLIASGGADGVLRIHDWASGEELSAVIPAEGFIHDLAFEPSNNELLVAHPDAPRIWDVAQLVGPLSLVGHRGELVHEGIGTPDGEILITAGSDGTVRTWSPTTGMETRRLSPHEGAVLSVALDPYASYAATLGSDRRVLIFQTDEVKVLRALDVAPGVRRVRFCPQGALLATASLSISENPQPIYAITLYEVPEGRAVRQFVGHTDSITDHAFSADGSLLATASHDQSVRLWNTDTGALLQTMFLVEPTESARGPLATRESCVPWSLQFSADGTSVYAGYSDGRVAVWSTESGQKQAVIFAHGANVSGMDLAADGKRLVTGAWYASEIKLWDAATGDLVMEVDTGIEGIADVSFVPTRDAILVTGVNGGVRLLEIEAPPGSYTSRRDIVMKARDQRMDEEAWVSAMAQALMVSRIQQQRGDFAAATRTLGDVLEQSPRRLHQDQIRMQSLLKRYRDWCAAAADALAQPTFLDKSDLEKLAGIYTERRITYQNGTLQYSHEYYPGTHELIPMGDNAFMVQGVPEFRIRFDLDRDGNPVQIIGLYRESESDVSPRTGDPEEIEGSDGV